MLCWLDQPLATLHKPESERHPDVPTAGCVAALPIELINNKTRARRQRMGVSFSAGLPLLFIPRVPAFLGLVLTPYFTP